MLAIDDRVGTVEVGKRADLVMLPQDPLTHPGAWRDIAFTLRDGVARTPASGWPHGSYRNGTPANSASVVPPPSSASMSEVTVNRTENCSRATAPAWRRMRSTPSRAR